MGTRIYMEFADIKGMVEDPKHKNWVELQSCHYSVNRPVSQLSGSANRNVNSASVSSITITKEMNRSSQKMFTEAHCGKGISLCTIHFVDDKGTYLEYKLSNAILSSYHVDHIEEMSKPREVFSIHFTRIDTRYTPNEFEGGAPCSAGYDIPTASNL